MKSINLLNFGVFTKIGGVCMYESDKTVERIKIMAKEKGVKIIDMLEQCELNKNTLSSMKSRNSWIQSNSLAKIADYLDCSVDYLLGRSDNPTELYSEKSGAITNDHGNIVTGNGNIVSNRNDNGVEQPDEMTAELIKAFRAMCFTDKLKVMNVVMKIVEE